MKHNLLSGSQQHKYPSLTHHDGEVVSLRWRRLLPATSSEDGWSREAGGVERTVVRTGATHVEGGGWAGGDTGGGGLASYGGDTGGAAARDSHNRTHRW